MLGDTSYLYFLRSFVLVFKYFDFEVVRKYEYGFHLPKNATSS